MASSGPNSPGTLASEAHGTSTVAWTSPGNAAAQDDVYASANVTAADVTEYLKATGFGFAIPAGANVDGIQVEVERYASASPNGAEDELVHIVKGGTVQTAANRATATDWPAGADTDTYASSGGPTDLWGVAWDASDINAAGFGAAIAAVGLASVQVEIDHVRITVYYTPPAPAGAGGLLLLGVG